MYVHWHLLMATPLLYRSMPVLSCLVFFSYHVIPHHGQNYLDWMEATKEQNNLASYSVWPFGPKVVRDTCNLWSDLEADPRFAVHTSIFLSNGAGWDFAGGVALYADYNHQTKRMNDNPRHKIRRGVTVDGTRGRVVVSTGGMENRRCRMPTRAGIRAVLQIWWNCQNEL